MKRLTYLVLLLCCIATTALQAEIGVIVEIRKSRFALHRLSSASMPTRDMDGDGIPELWSHSGNTGTMDTITVYNGATFAAAWTYVYNTQGNGIQELIGFLHFEGPGETSHAILATRAAGMGEGYAECIIVNRSMLTAEYSYSWNAPQGGIFLTVPIGSGNDILLIADGPLIFAVGEKIMLRGGGSGAAFLPSAMTLPRTMTKAAAFSLTEKFRFPKGMRLAYDTDLFTEPSKLDFDLDGFPDLPVLVDTGDGAPVGLVVRAGDSLQIIWRFDFPDAYRGNLLSGFHGFSDLNGDGIAELIAGRNLVVLRDGTVYEIDPAFTILDMFDGDGDGTDDILGIDAADSTLVLYGWSPVASASRTPRSSFRLSSNYPNPFTPGTVIPFTLDHAAQVRLMIYDLQGRHVRTLADELYGSGMHQLSWDGRDENGAPVPGGMYVSSLSLGNDTQTRRMLLVK